MFFGVGFDSYAIPGHTLGLLLDQWSEITAISGILCGAQKSNMDQLHARQALYPTQCRIHFSLWTLNFCS